MGELEKEFAMVVLKFEPAIQQYDHVAAREDLLVSRDVPFEVARMLESAAEMGTEDLVDGDAPGGIANGHRSISRNALDCLEVVDCAPDGDGFVAELLRCLAYRGYSLSPFRLPWCILCIVFFGTEIVE